jgi:predicted NBD/HSP70 family sugar kinase/DNA-binding transcriptional ArsR family regulator
MLRHPPRTSPGRLAGSSKLLRAMNESATLEHLLDRGSLTRGDLRELTGLSKPTTSDVLRRLTDAGLALVVGHTRGGPGPNAEIYAANPAAAYAAAVSVRETADLSRPELTCALIDLAGTVHTRTQDSVDLSKTDPLTVIAGLVDQLAERAGLERSVVSHVHLGVPGSYDPGAGIIHHIDIPGFGRPGLVAELSERLGAAVQVDNDVNLAAIAERGRGVGAGDGSFALVWFGEGLGLAIDLGGHLLRGARGGAGEIGYVPVGFGGEPQDMQSLVGGPAVVELATEHGLTAAGPGEAVSTATAAGNTAFLDALAARVAQCVAAVAGVLDPPLIVLAGEVAQAGGEDLAERVRAALASVTPLDISIAVTGITDDAVLLGAVDAGLRAVRDELINALRTNVPAN